jgi:hypothetical protein
MTIEETTINDNGMNENDTIMNYMIAEDIISDIASITTTLESHRINTKQATLNASINGKVHNQPNNTIYGTPVASINNNNINNINNNKNNMQ